jgi:hypothetical protein
MTHFKRYLATFTILHLVFNVLFVVTLNLLSALTDELNAYLWWVLIVFDLEGIVIQTVIFSFFSKFLTRNKTIFLIAALIIELLFLNLFILFYGNWKEFSNNLVTSITSKSFGMENKGPLIFYASLIISTVVTISIREKAYQKTK